MNNPSTITPADTPDDPPPWLIKSLQAYATLTYALCSIAALVLFAAAYDAADPKLPPTALVTLAAVFVAASFTRAEAAPAALLMAAVGLGVATIKSRHPSDLNDTFIYGTLAFALLGSGIAAYWIFGPGLSEPRPFNRVDAIYAGGVAAAALAVVLVGAAVIAQWAPPAPTNYPGDWDVSKAFDVGQAIALTVPTLLVALILGARIKLPGVWDFITRVDKDHVCRSTELMVLAAGWALIGLLAGDALTESGTYAPPLAGAAIGVLVGVVVWLWSTLDEPYSLVARRSVRREWSVAGAGFILLGLLVYSMVKPDDTAGAYAITGLVVWVAGVAWWARFRR